MVFKQRVRQGIRGGPLARNEFSLVASSYVPRSLPNDPFAAFHPYRHSGGARAVIKGRLTGSLCQFEFTPGTPFTA